MWCLHHHSSQNDGRHDPITSVLPDLKIESSAVFATGRCSAIWQGTVDDQVLGAIDVRDGDQGLVQRSVASVTNEIVQVLLVVVFLAATRVVLLTQASDRECGVCTIGVGRVRFALIDESISTRGQF